MKIHTNNAAIATKNGVHNIQPQTTTSILQWWVKQWEQRRKDCTKKKKKVQWKHSRTFYFNIYSLNYLIYCKDLMRREEDTKYQFFRHTINL